MYRRTLRWVLVTTIYALTATAVGSLLFIRAAQGDFFSDSNRNLNSYSDQIYFKVGKPFVGRLLMPLLLRGIDYVTPSFIEQRVASAVSSSGFLKSFGWSTQHNYSVFIALLCLWLFPFLLCFIYRQCLIAIYAFPSWFADIGGALATLFVASLFINFHPKLYDLPTILLTAGAVWSLSRDRSTAFYAVFVAACLNRETAIVLTCLFCCLRFFTDKKSLFRHALLQFVIWSFIRAGIAAFFADHPGSSFQFMLQRNTVELAATAPVHYLVYLAFIIVFWMTVIAYGWRKNPLLWRYGFAAVVVPMSIFNLVFGEITEMRIYCEILPLLSIFGIRSTADLLEIPIDTSSIYQNAVTITVGTGRS